MNLIPGIMFSFIETSASHSPLGGPKSYNLATMFCWDPNPFVPEIGTCHQLAHHACAQATELGAQALQAGFQLGPEEVTYFVSSAVHLKGRYILSSSIKCFSVGGSTRWLKQKPHLLLLKTVLLMNGLVCTCVFIHILNIYIYLDKFLEAELLGQQ